MYCKLFINCDDREKILTILKNRFGNCHSLRNDHSFGEFDIHIIANKEQGADRFLGYPAIADLEINGRYAELTDEILHIMRINNIHTVAACDYEDELKHNGSCKGELV